MGQHYHIYDPQSKGTIDPEANPPTVSDQSKTPPTHPVSTTHFRSIVTGLTDTLEEL